MDARRAVVHRECRDFVVWLTMEMRRSGVDVKWPGDDGFASQQEVQNWFANLRDTARGRDYARRVL
jgi:hypothetical protein